MEMLRETVWEMVLGSISEAEMRRLKWRAMNWPAESRSSMVKKPVSLTIGYWLTCVKTTYWSICLKMLCPFDVAVNKVDVALVTAVGVELNSPFVEILET